MHTFKHIFYDFFGYNTTMFKWLFLNTHYESVVQASKAYTFFGYDTFTTPIHLLFITAAYLAYSKYKHSDSTHNLKPIFIWVVSLVLGIIFIGSLKYIAQLPRPCCFQELMEMVKAAPICIDCKCEYESFPSGHVAYMTSFVLSFWSVMNIPARLIGVLLITLASLYRITLARHFPADVIAGILAGLICVAVAKIIVERKEKS